MNSERVTGYSKKTGKMIEAYRPVDVTMDEMADGLMGFCLGCGAEVMGVEPDARRYECESCGKTKVYGLEELLMMGVITSVDGGH